MGGTSRMSREAYVRFCERLGVKFPGPTRRWETGRRFGVSARAHPRLHKVRCLHFQCQRDQHRRRFRLSDNTTSTVTSTEALPGAAVRLRSSSAIRS